MKKFFMMLAVALPMFFMASCGDDNDETALSLDKTAAELNYGTTVKLIPSEKKGEWASSNEFVATVDKDGNVKAEHVGKATITYVKDGESASCVVTVKATNDYFDTYMNFGASKATVKANIPATYKLLMDGATDLMYSATADEDAYPWYGFYFENDKLEGSSIYFDDQIFDDNDLKGFLKQRYILIDNEDPEDDELVYVNANTVSEASIAATVDYDPEDDTYVLTYMPVSHVRSQAIDMTIPAHARALFKSMKNK